MHHFCIKGKCFGSILGVVRVEKNRNNIGIVSNDILVRMEMPFKSI